MTSGYLEKSISRVFGDFYIFIVFLLKVVKANSANPDQMAHSWMSDLVLQF